MSAPQENHTAYIVSATKLVYCPTECEPMMSLEQAYSIVMKALIVFGGKICNSPCMGDMTVERFFFNESTDIVHIDWTASVYRSQLPPILIYRKGFKAATMELVTAIGGDDNVVLSGIIL